MSALTKFILVGLVLIAVAIGATVYVWMTLQNSLTPSPVEIPTGESAPIVEKGLPIATPEQQAAAEKSEEVAIEEPVTETITEPIPVKSLPLSDTQKKAAETVGIDVDTFEITPAMVACAEGKLGAARVAELVGGASPSFLEIASLAGCL